LANFISLAVLVSCSSEEQKSNSTWDTFGHDVSNNKFSKLAIIDTSNVTKLKEVWRYSDSNEDGGIYFNPVMMNNRVIGLMPTNKLVALDAITGKLLWSLFRIHRRSLTGQRNDLPCGSPDRIFLISGETCTLLTRRAVRSSAILEIMAV